jgi:hypothetical protein
VTNLAGFAVYALAIAAHVLTVAAAAGGAAGVRATFVSRMALVSEGFSASILVAWRERCFFLILLLLMMIVICTRLLAQSPFIMCFFFFLSFSFFFFFPLHSPSADVHPVLDAFLRYCAPLLIYQSVGGGGVVCDAASKGDPSIRKQRSLFFFFFFFFFWF